MSLESHWTSHYKVCSVCSIGTREYCDHGYDLLTALKVADGETGFERITHGDTFSWPGPAQIRWWEADRQRAYYGFRTPAEGAAIEPVWDEGDEDHWRGVQEMAAIERDGLGA